MTTTTITVTGMTCGHGGGAVTAVAIDLVAGGDSPSVPGA